MTILQNNITNISRLLFVSPLFFSYCNETHENVFGSVKKRVETFLPQLFQPNLLCAGYESSEQGSCLGDSGGPLMFFKPSNHK
jgi:hypothetical protein